MKTSKNIYGFLKFLGGRKLEHWLKIGSYVIILSEDTVFHANFLLLLLLNGRASNKLGDGFALEIKNWGNRGRNKLKRVINFC